MDSLDVRIFSMVGSWSFWNEIWMASRGVGSLPNAERMKRVSVTRMPLEIRNSLSNLFCAAADASAIASKILLLPLPFAPMRTVRRPRSKARFGMDL